MDRYSLTFNAVPHGSTAFTKPEKAKTTPAKIRQKLAKIFNLLEGIFLLVNAVVDDAANLLEDSLGRSHLALVAAIYNIHIIVTLRSI